MPFAKFRVCGPRESPVYKYIAAFLRNQPDFLPYHITVVTLFIASGAFALVALHVELTLKKRAFLDGDPLR